MNTIRTILILLVTGSAVCGSAAGIPTTCSEAKATKGSDPGNHDGPGWPLALYSGRKAICDFDVIRGPGAWLTIHTRDCQFLNEIKWNTHLLHPETLKRYQKDLGNPDAQPGNAGYNIYGNPRFKNDAINSLNMECSFAIAERAKSLGARLELEYEVIQHEVAVPYLNSISIVSP